MECKDRKNRTAIMLPYSFLPSMATKELRDVAAKVGNLPGDQEILYIHT